MNRMVSWSEYNNALVTLGTNLCLCGFRHAPILAISRGGLIPGVALSHMIESPELFVVSCKSYEGVNQLPTVKLKWSLDFTTTVDGLIVVDDLIDTGRTLSVVSNWLTSSKKVERFYTAVVFDKIRPDRAIQADLVGQSISPEDWVVFPYETTLDLTVSEGALMEHTASL